MVRFDPGCTASFAGGEDQTYVSPMLLAYVQSGTIEGQITHGSPLLGRGCGMYCCHVSRCDALLVYRWSPTLSAPIDAMLGADTKIACAK